MKKTANDIQSIPLDAVGSDKTKVSFRSFMEIYGWDETHPYVDDLVEKIEKRVEDQKKRYPVILLNALLAGVVVEHDNYKWTLDANNELCVVGHNQTTGEDVLLRVDVSLGAFIKMALEMTEIQMTVIGANTVLNTKP
jgi:hypothetical protein